MSRETLSMKQANNIANQFGSVMFQIVEDVSNKNHEFYMAVKKIWQDQNACDFQDQHSQNIYDMIQTLKKNYSIFIKTLEDIANSYAKAGGMHEKFSPMLNESMIFNASLSYTEIGAHKFHPYFTEGYGMMETFTDEFGFINPETGGQEVLDVFNELVTFLEKRTDEIVNEIKGINAFGNITVKLNLAKSSGLVVTELSDALSKSSKQIQELLQKTASTYMNVGQNAAGAASIGGSSGSSSGGASSSGSSSISSEPKPGDSLSLDESTITSAKERMEKISSGELPRTWIEMRDDSVFKIIE